VVAAVPVDMRVSSLSFGTLIAVLEAVAGHPSETIPAIADFAGIGGSTTGRAVATLTALGLIKRAADNRFVCTASEIRRGVDEQTARQVIRRALIAYRPFEVLCQGLALGENYPHAVRKTIALLGLPADQAQKFNLLAKWGTELGILQEHTDGSIKLAIDASITSPPGGPILLPEDVESEVKARLYLAVRLGRDAYNYVDEADRHLLVGSLLSFQSDPRKAVERAGQATENFLREVAKEKGLDAEAKKLNGAGQLASLLVSKGLMHSHQQKLVDVVGTFRNATAHNKDKKTLVPWDITDHGAFTSVMAAITSIRSLHHLLANGKQEL